MSSLPSISTLSRSSTISELEHGEYDLIVIGGGITGAGIVRDAAMRGLSVALFEAHDFASGTSSRSSKLIHGGLRYLERGEFNLVRKTALERKEIHRLAPHLCEPRLMVLPLRTRAKLLGLRLGITAYERLGAVASKDSQRTWSGSSLAEHEPLLNARRFPFALAYREYLTDDARLVLANIRSAAGFGAAVLNHAPVVGFIREGESAVGVEVRDSLTGREFRVRGRVIVNAAGPWVEAIQRLEDPGSRPLLHLSKGVHIAVPASKLPIRNLVVLKTRDRRRIFAIRRSDIVYIGTTDSTYEPGARVWPEVEREDVEYLLEPLPLHFNIDPLTPDDVIGAWAGLRPLIANPEKKNPSELSRRDELLTGPLGLISVAGGKLTGYRGMARRVLHNVAERLGRSFRKIGEEPPLPGGDFPSGSELADLGLALCRESNLDEETGERLARLYGTEARSVLALGSRPIFPGARAIIGEVRWAVEREGAATLEDLFYRRARLPMFWADATRAVEPLANLLSERLGWNHRVRAAEIERVERQLGADLGFLQVAR
ncbi:MAG TPA: glycerol-3-phosphate dehydrogenase/oxidase [Enhygromyxa sp.]|nr:glycerol-3-phosphate dehydrogenase/oxidase [Enhygromyxa sp.]